MGRKAAYNYTDKDFLRTLRLYAEQGLSDSEIASELDITPECFSRRKARHPEMVDALRMGRVRINAMLKNRFLQLALGGIVLKVYKERIVRRDEIVVTTERESLPSLQAICNWLYHHDEDWRKVERKKSSKKDETSGGSDDLSGWIKRNTIA